MRHPANRYCRDLGRRACRAILHPQRRSAWRKEGDRDRSTARPSFHGQGRRGGRGHQLNFEEDDVFDRLNDLTEGKGPDKCIDAVGLESHATASFNSVYDRAKQALMLESDRPHVLRQMIFACRPAGVLSIPGVYGGLVDKIPFGALMNNALTVRTAQTHVNRWTPGLLRRVEEGQIDPSFVITHKIPLSKGPQMYKTFREKSDGCVKAFLKPGGMI